LAVGFGVCRDPSVAGSFVGPIMSFVGPIMSFVGRSASKAKGDLGVDFFLDNSTE